MDNIKLYAFALSPYALKVKCYLLFLGVDFETIYIDPLKVRTGLPVGKTVPVLTINNESRNESSELGYWLNKRYPEKQLIPDDLLEKNKLADQWVNNRLINHVFRETTGFDEGFINKVKTRLKSSKSLALTVPNGIPFWFPALHVLLLDFTFVRHHIAMTDKTRTLTELKFELAREFETLLKGGPFLHGNDAPTMADLSAYPQIVQPKVIDGKGYFLLGDTVKNWVTAMESAVPNLVNCFPDSIKLIGCS